MSPHAASQLPSQSSFLPSSLSRLFALPAAKAVDARGGKGGGLPTAAVGGDNGDGSASRRRHPARHTVRRGGTPRAAARRCEDGGAVEGKRGGRGKWSGEQWRGVGVFIGKRGKRERKGDDATAARRHDGGRRGAGLGALVTRGDTTGGDVTARGTRAAMATAWRGSGREAARHVAVARGARRRARGARRRDGARRGNGTARGAGRRRAARQRRWDGDGDRRRWRRRHGGRRRWRQRAAA
uniref:Uncharacterized protein n=1 Tax=Oryza sativa subsp. japonica TaxID=39947 RepID=Q68UR7_ORYSJ|nr:hypothetical protein [Oryza sativa Japonica Group]